jgi:acyl carrier protein
MEQKLLEIINVVLENNDAPLRESLSDDLDLRNGLGFDSINLAELTVRIEEEFGVDIFQDRYVQTLGEVKQALNEKLIK